jgi:hypothetical protein
MLPETLISSSKTLKKYEYDFFKEVEGGFMNWNIQAF